MKREDVKAKIPGITDEQLNWLMDENGSDINAEKGNAARIQGELDTANATIKNLRDTVKKYDGVDVEALRQQLGTLQTKYDTDIAAVRRDEVELLACLDALLQCVKAHFLCRTHFYQFPSAARLARIRR